MKTAVIDRTGSLFFRSFKGAKLFSSVEQLLKGNLKEYQAIILNGEHGKLELSTTSLNKLWSFVEAGGIVYGEMVVCEDFPSSRFFGFKQDFPYSYRRLEKMKYITNSKEENDSNLLEWNGPFLTGFAINTEVILEIGVFQETHATTEDGSYPGLSVRPLGKGKVIYAAFPLFSNNEIWSLRPFWLWKKIVTSLQTKYGLPCTMFNETIQFKKQTIEEAVDNSIQWFLRSGIMPDPSGNQGVYENIHSIKGTVSKDIRPDCNAHTALMFYLYGEYKQDKTYVEISENIFNHLFNNGFQDNETDSPTYGLWKWFDFPETKPDQIFTDDNAWVALILLYLYKKTGIEEYKRRGLITTKAMLETQNRNGLRPEVLIRSEVLEKGKEYYQQSNIASMNPHFESIAHAAFLLAYEVTGEDTYLETAKSGTIYLLDHIEKHKYMYSKTSGFSRFLLALAQLSKLTDDEKIKDGLYHIIAYLKSNQHRKGPVAEADNPAPDRYGSEDTGVFIHDNEEIADQLYTNNFLAMNVWEAWKATDDKELFEFHKEISNFLANMQIQSDRKEFNGGWMRSYHLRRDEYFGNNGDTGWGPYCIESGWTNGILTSGFLLKLLDSSLID